MTKYKNYTDEDIINNSKLVTSLAGLLKSLNLRACGGNYSNMKRNLQRLNVDTSHWKGQGWSKDQQLKDWSEYTKHVFVKKHIMKNNPHKCMSCKLEVWLGEPITLELEHIDADRTNNDPTNLRLLCPNCHSQTSTWKRGRAKGTPTLNPSLASDFESDVYSSSTTAP